MRYTRLVGSLVEECVAASLGGYDEQDVLAEKGADDDLIRATLVRAVCDPRFKGTARATKVWEDYARNSLESFASELLAVENLDGKTADFLMEQFLIKFFLSVMYALGKKTGRNEKGAGASRGGDLQAALRLMGSGEDSLEWGKEENDGSSRGPSEEKVFTRSEERRFEMQFLREIPSSLKELARRIGRVGGDEQGPAKHFLAASRSDIAGITVGNDPGSLLPSEVALLAVPETEDVFLRGYAEKRLQVFGSASTGNAVPLDRQDGPVIICLDRSGSMSGEPSDVARSLTMAVTIIAKRRHREVIVVNYGNCEQECFTVKNLRKDRRALVGFLSFESMGGNNEDGMFRWLFGEVLPQERAFRNADVLCVSDMEWSDVRKEAMELIDANKARGMKFYGLKVSMLGDWEMEGDFTLAAGKVIDEMWEWDTDLQQCREAE